MCGAKLTAEEREILDAIESGTWKPEPLTEKEIQHYSKAARLALKKRLR